jgi:hypothetical protein
MESSNLFLDAEWVLGNTIAVDTCRKMNVSYVKLEIESVDKGVVGSKTVFLTIEQFKELHSEVKRVQNIIKAL